MSNGYEIACSITALCPSCGKELPSSSYLTESRPGNGPFDRDNPCERKDRRVFITPCADCYEYKPKENGMSAPKLGTEFAYELVRCANFLEEAVTQGNDERANEWLSKISALSERYGSKEK